MCDNSYMRILLVCQYYSPEPISVSRIAEDLVKRGHEVTVLTGLPNYGFGRILEGYEKPITEEINGVHVVRVKLKPRTNSKKSLIANYLSFWRHAKRKVNHLGRFDLVYGIQLSPVISMAPAIKYAKKRHVPFVLSCYDLWPESPVASGYIKKNSLAYKILYLWSRKIYAKADKILTSSPAFEPYFKDVLKLDKNISTVYQPPVELEQADAPKSYETKTNIVYAGNLGKLQRVDQFVEAMKFLQPGESIHLWVLGSGVEGKRIEEIVEKYHLQDRVSLIGLVSQQEVANYVANATALVVSLPSSDSVVSETIPSKLVTSLGCGKPIIAAVGESNKKILMAAKGSYFTNPDSKNIGDVYRKIAQESKNNLIKMGEDNLAYYKIHFEFSKVMDSLERELKSCKKE